MNWSNDFNQLNLDFFKCLVWHGSLYFDLQLSLTGQTTRRELVNFQNMLLMGAEMNR